MLSPLIIGTRGQILKTRYPCFTLKKRVPVPGSGLVLREKERCLAWQILTGMLNHSVSQFSALLVSSLYTHYFHYAKKLWQSGWLQSKHYSAGAAVLILSSQKIVPLLHILIQHIQRSQQLYSHLHFPQFLLLFLDSPCQRVLTQSIGFKVMLSEACTAEGLYVQTYKQ